MSASGRPRNVADDHTARPTDITNMNIYQCQIGPERYLEVIHLYLYLYLYLSIYNVTLTLCSNDSNLHSFWISLPHQPFTFYIWTCFLTIHKKMEIKRFKKCYYIIKYVYIHLHLHIVYQFISRGHYPYLKLIFSLALELNFPCLFRNYPIFLQTFYYLCISLVILSFFFAYPFVITHLSLFWLFIFI